MALELLWSGHKTVVHTVRVSVTPNPASALTTERMRVQLKVSYDILYNVSVQSTPTCGKGSSITVSIELHHGEYIRIQK